MLSFMKRRRASLLSGGKADGDCLNNQRIDTTASAKASTPKPNKSKAPRGSMKMQGRTTTTITKNNSCCVSTPPQRNDSCSSVSGRTARTSSCSSELSSTEFRIVESRTHRRNLSNSSVVSAMDSSIASIDQAPQIPQRPSYTEADHDDDVSTTSSGDYEYGDATPKDTEKRTNTNIHCSIATYRPIRRASIQYNNDEDTSNNGYGYYGDAAVVTSPNASSMYGYGDAAPDTSKYGYGDASPESDSKYGYGDASPASVSVSNKYGYGDASPDSASSVDSAPRPPERRSSMKMSGAPRRSSIGYTGEKEVILPGKRAVKRRTSISFDEQVKVRNVEPVTELARNPEKLWFQAEDYEKMRRKSMTLVNMVEKNGGVDTFDGRRKKVRACVRGLECLMGNEGEIRSLRRYDAYGVVMYEQHNQRNDGIFYDDESMSMKYSATTLESKEQAEIRAKQDEMDIEVYTRETRNFCRRLSM